MRKVKKNTHKKKLYFVNMGQDMQEKTEKDSKKNENTNNMVPSINTKDESITKPETPQSKDEIELSLDARGNINSDFNLQMIDNQNNNSNDNQNNENQVKNVRFVNEQTNIA